MRTRSWVAWGALALAGLAYNLGWASAAESSPYGAAFTIAALLVYGIAPEKKRP